MKLPKSKEEEFRKLAEEGYGDDVLYLDNYAWVVFRINEHHQIMVRQKGAIYDKVEVRKNG